MFSVVGVVGMSMAASTTTTTVAVGVGDLQTAVENATEENVEQDGATSHSHHGVLHNLKILSYDSLNGHVEQDTCYIYEDNHSEKGSHCLCAVVAKCH